MNDRPLISIITITYNASRVISPTLQSVKEQNFKDFEHLIIDGASKDDTILVARKEGTEKIRIISEPDDGLYFAMNKGIENARGKYIIFLNAGDTFHSNDTLAHYAEHILKTDDDIIYGDTVIVNDKREFIARRHLDAPAVLTKESFAKGMLICHQAFMVKKEIAPKYDTHYRFSSDFDWTIRCIKRTQPNRCHNLNEVTIDYLSDGLTDKNKLKSLKERFRIMSHHYGTLPTIGHHILFVLRAAKRKATKSR